MITDKKISFFNIVVDKKKVVKNSIAFHRKAVIRDEKSTEKFFKWLNDHYTGLNTGASFPIFKYKRKQYIIASFFYAIPWQITLTPLKAGEPVTIKF